MISSVWARQPLPAPGAASIFLAGPTPRVDTVASWRDDAVALLERLWQGPGELSVLLPESQGGARATSYDDQFEWECDARQRATVRAFWIPRDLATLPGFTTNVEFGHDVLAHALCGHPVVLGAPPHCPDAVRNRYLVALARRYDAPVRETLAATMGTALDLVRAGCADASGA